MQVNFKRQKFLNLFHFLIDFLYPPYCSTCSALLQHEEKIVCDVCWNSIPTVDDEYDILTEIKSKLSSRIYFARASSVWHFQGPIQHIIHLLKYQNFQIVTRKMGEFMAEKIQCWNAPLNEMLLIPVPLHKTRTRERGYNQSLLLCKSISAITGIPFSNDMLLRNRYTKSQTSLNAINRQKNVADAFNVISKEAIKEKIVILVDDVITTGATMNACAKALSESGASEIFLLSSAKA